MLGKQRGQQVNASVHPCWTGSQPGSFLLERPAIPVDTDLWLGPLTSVGALSAGQVNRRELNQEFVPP